MPTFYCTIGNSDDKLTQQEWSNYTTELHDIVWQAINEQPAEGSTIHCVGFTASGSRWQSMIISGTATAKTLERITRQLPALALKYRQESIAWNQVAETVFISALKPPPVIGDDQDGQTRSIDGAGSNVFGITRARRSASTRRPPGPIRPDRA